MAQSDTSGASTSLRSLLETCSDDRLLTVLSALLRALPSPSSKERCAAALRQALAAELDASGDRLKVDQPEAEGGGNAIAAGLVAAAEATWRRILAPPAVGDNATKSSSAAAQSGSGSQVKRPARAMAMPFVSQVKKMSEDRQEEKSSNLGSSDETKEQEGTGAQETDDQDMEDEGVEADAGSQTSTVFVANLPFLTDTEQVKQFFEEHCGGPTRVQSVKLHVNLTGKPKGTAVIVLSDAAAARSAVALNGEVFGDRELIVRLDGQKGKGKGKSKGKEKGKDKSKNRPTRTGNAATAEADSRSVVVKNLPWNATEVHIGEFFAGSGEVNAVRIAKDSKTARPKGFAVVEFKEKSSLVEALKRSGKEMRGRAVRVEALWAPAGAGTEDADDDPANISDSRAAEIEAEMEANQDEVDGKAVAATKKRMREAVAFIKGDGLSVTEGNTADANASDAQDDQNPSVTEEKVEGTSMHSHAQQLLAQASAAVVKGSGGAVEEGSSQKKQRCNEPTTAAPVEIGNFVGGDEGLCQAAGVAERANGSAEALLASEGAEGLKGRLQALGMKAGGAPLERAKRILRLKGLTKLSDVPRDLLSKPPPQPRKPIAFVAATESDKEKAGGGKLAPGEPEQEEPEAAD
eukprot:TRINITY_DN6304_c0_g1_i1.p1 TRINITY_DN6304_c0_g1~~TRINITY_DN6304_c0_g1_i1.p1  ORF type:complete len:634 (+),score=189.96 TRINITY_DN6304_c0_g1_i1:50-1951(+)